jgi:dienelactone hydrolase
MTQSQKEKRRAELRGLLGDLPSRDLPLAAMTVSVEERETYVLERLVLDLNGLEQVPACFIRPKGLSGRAPAILYNHSHGGAYNVGKEELFNGQPYILPYAPVLAEKGWCVLCIDAWAFGERRGRTEGEIFKEMLWSGRVMWGMMVYDSLRAVDYLASRAEVDASRLGTLGMSMGSTMAWWVAALDPRVRVCVDLCCLTDYQALIADRGLERHGLYYYVPGLLKHFTTSEINALIAPRPHLGTAGNHDLLTPAAGLDRIDRELRAAYAAEGVPDAWKLSRYDCGHLETAAMRKEVVEFLAKWL